MIKNSIEDINNILLIVYKITTENEGYSLYEQIIEENSRQMLDCFRKTIGINLVCNNSKDSNDSNQTQYYEEQIKKSNMSELIGKINKWLNNNYHPKLLSEFFTETVAYFKFEIKVKQLIHYRSLLNWINFWNVAKSDLYNYEISENNSDLKPEELKEFKILLNRLYIFIEEIKMQIS